MADLTATDIIFLNQYPTREYSITCGNKDVLLNEFYDFVMKLQQEITSYVQSENHEPLTPETIYEMAFNLIISLNGQLIQQNYETINNLPINISLSENTTSDSYTTIIKNTTTSFIIQGLKFPLFSKVFVIEEDALSQNLYTAQNLHSAQNTQTSQKQATPKFIQEQFITYLQSMSHQSPQIEKILNYLQSNKTNLQEMRKLQSDYYDYKSQPNYM